MLDGGVPNPGNDLKSSIVGIPQLQRILQYQIYQYPDMRCTGSTSLQGTTQIQTL